MNSNSENRMAEIPITHRRSTMLRFPVLCDGEDETEVDTKAGLRDVSQRDV